MLQLMTELRGGYEETMGATGTPTRARRRVAAICRDAATPLADRHERAEALVLALAVAVEIRDRNTEAHCARIATHAASTGARLGLDAGDRRTLLLGGYLHDVGKIAISDSILLKPGALTAAEEEVMRLHPLIGDALCGRFPMLAPVRPIVRWHHERLDGSGYPDGLKGDRIPLLAQIASIADVYDAVTTARPYKVAVPADIACEMLVDEARRGYRRRDLVEAFIQTVAVPVPRVNSQSTMPSGRAAAGPPFRAAA